MTNPSNKISEKFSEEIKYLSIGNGRPQTEQRIFKTKNRESIRYKYQLDYKEKLKMERENFLKEYAEKRKISQNHHRAKVPTNEFRSIYQNMEGQIKEVPRIARNPIFTNEQLMGLSPQRSSHRHLGESLETRSERQYQAFSDKSNIADESIKYYNTENGSNNGCESIDLTKDFENSISEPQSEVKQMRLVRNLHGNLHTEINRNKQVDDSNLLPSPGKSDHKIPKKSLCEDFDFSIPFNESNILIKVMTSDGRNSTNPTTKPGSLLQETLRNDTAPKPELNASERVSFDEEPKENTATPKPGSGNQWLQYIQNILNKTCDPREGLVNKKVTVDHSKATGKLVEKKHSNDLIPKSNADLRPISTTVTAATSTQPKLIKINKAVSAIPHTTNYYDVSSTERKIKQDRPLVSNQRLVRPKVIHLSPYFRSDSSRNNSQFNDHPDVPIGVTLTASRHQPVAQIPDPSNVPQHMEYIYGNHPNYHHEFNMVRSMRLPLDISHPRVIGHHPIYSPYDQHNYAQYRNEMELISQPCVDPYIQHNIPPLQPSIGFFPPRPAAPGVYRYLHPQHVHPIWIYPHMLEK